MYAESHSGKGVFFSNSVCGTIISFLLRLSLATSRAECCSFGTGGIGGLLRPRGTLSAIGEPGGDAGLMAKGVCMLN
jgi:hypothetical protein